MALIPCNECGKEISAKASTCPHCGDPIAKELLLNCKLCGGPVKKVRESEYGVRGYLILLAASVIYGVLSEIPLAAFLIAVPLAVWGMGVSWKANHYWQCKKCNEKFPRIRKWYEIT